MTKKIVTKYAYRTGARVSGIPADLAYAELERIRRDNGALRPDDVVAEASPEDAPLHPVFEWDDSVAAAEHRLLQARLLIRAVVTVKGGSQTQVYVHVPLVTGGDYQTMAAVVANPDRYALTLAELERKIEGIQRTIDELHQLASQSNDADALARISVAIAAFRVAGEAVHALAH